MADITMRCEACDHTRLVFACGRDDADLWRDVACNNPDCPGFGHTGELGTMKVIERRPHFDSFISTLARP